jgi:hypothetical protein
MCRCISPDHMPNCPNHLTRSEYDEYGEGWCAEHEVSYIGDCPVCASEDESLDGDDGGQDIEPSTAPKVPLK